MRRSCLALHLTAALLLLSSPFHLATAAPAATASSSAAAPLSIGESFSIDSQALKEKRHINVYMARAWDTPPDAPLPVLYMPDGGVAEDFLHVAGLLQVSVANGTMRPFMLVGMQNTQRRRDLTGPTGNAEDRKIAPVVGGASAYRAFIRDELMPEIKRRYRTTGETAIVGESLGGLFAVETYLLEPQLFDHYLAFDPSLWWNRGALPRQAAALLAKGAPGKHSLYMASSSEAGIAIEVQRLADVLQKQAPPGLQWHLEKMPEETHGTIYHPAALKAFRSVFKPATPPQ
ncbi:alpha/beta hydrolase [Janthinobacterium lividum]|uniref:Alpha/beta hydrolase-fold protein n=1 Tax=Janthinobacterium lividum TaxID=29581 RepID=A0ABU0XMR1_9BURK|nr:alpha/beta hydrolase-fold protein [Janthinobacterium lividum]MDQ4624815.1 alpha/beta hydrolase-fold protein [Janthinobacterium lividum]MDQ4673582.1 alpha/beta hydrolase-fold protein [Janthinobacterium lividum]MDQ4684312.1 alpha/beta hydrolase-fold protein [Janthinobacterium lividum]